MATTKHVNPAPNFTTDIEAVIKPFEAHIPEASVAMLTNEERQAKIVELYTAGASVPGLAKYFGVSLGTVHNALRTERQEQELEPRRMSTNHFVFHFDTPFPGEDEKAFQERQERWMMHATRKTTHMDDDKAVAADIALAVQLTLQEYTADELAAAGVKPEIVEGYLEATEGA